MTTLDTMAGFRAITKSEFFSTVGQMDVTPWPVGSWDETRGYQLEWKDRRGQIIGISDGRDESNERYFVRER